MEGEAEQLGSTLASYTSVLESSLLEEQHLCWLTWSQIGYGYDTHQCHQSCTLQDPIYPLHPIAPPPHPMPQNSLPVLLSSALTQLALWYKQVVPAQKLVGLSENSVARGGEGCNGVGRLGPREVVVAAGTYLVALMCTTSYPPSWERSVDRDPLGLASVI